MQAIFNLKFKSKEQAEIILKALSPEINKYIPKTKIEITQKEEDIILSITSSQISSLRAACNSYLRWIYTAISVSEIQQ
ncbi:MAG: hypothetical protein DRN12_01610 [Thermoplasmata archaeon]|nr:MAG: hypothetical protein DRN12_01610 [Thermoplasmata archaeon]HEC89115.1 hypothetical protein [Thermoplasmatales archaeon]